MRNLIFLALSAYTVASTPTETTTALTSQESCLASCAPTDVNCQAICVGVPHPGATQMNETTQCIGQCPQGDGSAAAAQAYASCQDACISSFIITSGTAAPGGVYTTAGIAASSTSMIVTVTPNASGSGNGTAASTSSKGLAAAPTGLIGGGFGLVLAAVALL